jgi:tRNA A-37 threonylcarbamoyl transferase component Bud32/tetratricopeptide (TPR) repeat protein
MLPGAAPKRFELIRFLGEGGMGVVYEALDRERGARVALKTLRHASPEHLARLKREFRAMQEVQHPNLVALRELVCEDDRWFLTMDLVAGVDFISYVRAPLFVEETPPPSASSVRAIGSAPTIQVARARLDEPLFDAARLRLALRQLTEGLLALHAAGMVHRDVKPSNVLVTRDGRVVLLDFGLVAETRADASTVAAVGTPAYMAPEQAVSGDVGPAADWYATGVLLYEALTGRVPFEGAALQVMLRKQSEVPVPPAMIGAGVPSDLDALCVSLLRSQPGERPTGGAVLRQLGGTPRAGDAASQSRTLTPPFVGRTRELETLAGALADSRAEGVAVIIEGESGLGKSRLVRRFTERVALEDPQAVVLAGRCHERESVPYKALDGVVDALARLLARMPDAQVSALLPTRPAPLVQIFPVMRRVPAVAELVRAPAPALDPFELRSRAFAALRELFLRLGDRRPLIVVIDDAQWADHDGLALLAEITRPPDAPRMLLVATVRTAGAATGAGDARGEATEAGRERATARLARAVGAVARDISLSPLSPQDSRELAAALAARVGVEGEAVSTDAAAIAIESGGHPFFIDLLARAAAAPGVKVRLEDALGAQLGELDADARAIAETVAFASVPLAPRVVERASAVPADRFGAAVQRLRVARIVVTTGAPGDDRLEPYHDRVRVAVAAPASEARRADIHGLIARALETERDADAETLAFHWREAGDAEQAARFSVLAGDRAVGALAFDRAASFYQTALALGAQPDSERHVLLLKLGDALANAGRGKPAADVFRQAAEGASAAQALDLRRRAAEQLLRSGHFDQGVAALRSVLAGVGVRLPETRFGAVLQLLFYSLVLLLRGLRFRERDARDVPARALVRIDTCWSAAFGLALHDTVLASALQARTLLLALRLGEPFRVACALGFECGHVAHAGGRSRARTERMIERARRAAERCGDLYAIGWSAMGASVAHYLNGRYRPALARSDEALEAWRSYGRNVSWELDTAALFNVSTLAQLGELKLLRGRASRTLREAEDRGDLYATVNLRLGYGNLVWLVGDESAVARRQIDEAMGQWSKAGFHLEHFYELMARVHLDLYTGAAGNAHARVADRWTALQRSLLPWKIQSLRILSWHLRARAALAVATLGDDRDELLHAVVKDARRIEKEGMGWATPLAKMLRAGAAHVRWAADPQRLRIQEDARAVGLLREAVAGFDAADMALHAAVARRALGALLGGDEGAGLTAAADGWFQEQAVKRPERFIAMLAPGL